MGVWHDVGVDLLLYYRITAIFFILIISIAPVIANSLVFHYAAFNEGDLNLQGDAGILNSWIHVTAYQQNSTGQATHFQEMNLWDTSSTKLCNFWTTFAFRMQLNPRLTYSGSGFSFFLAHPNLTLFSNNNNNLGVVDGKQVLKSIQHSYVAIEFSILRNELAKSFKRLLLDSSDSDEGAYITPVYFDCSIGYDSATYNLSISCDIQHLHSHEIGLSYEIDFRDYLPESVIVGFLAATGNSTESHFLRSWSFNSQLDIPSQPLDSAKTEAKSRDNNGHSMRMWIGVGIAVPVTVSSMGLICFIVWKWKKSKEEEVCDLNMDEEFQKGSGPKKFSHDELVTATNNFSEEHKLGHGGFGDVYKGFMQDLNSEVAIKRISKDSRQGIKEYATEVKIISLLRHKNLVQLIGWCHKNKKDLLLIYEFLPNGSLDLHLHHGRRSFLTWEIRYNITLGLASALLYLHEEREQCVLHRDIKSSNVMLDSNFNPKLGDFGLARLMDHKKRSQTTVIRGTRGYISPEYFITGKASKESDVYSFGVVMLEIVSGRKPIDLNSEDERTIVDWVWELYGLGKFLEVADPKLFGEFNEKELEHLVVVGIWCAHPDHSCRPSIRQVIQVLNFEAPLPSLPQKMPVPTYLSPTII